MEYIKVTSENIKKEHICCALSNNNQKRPGCQSGLERAWFF